MAIARVMGNSVRAWGTNYDVAKAAREAAAGQAAYNVLLTSAAQHPTTQTAVEDPDGLPWGGSEPGQAGALVLAPRPKRARCSLLDEMLQQAAAAKVARNATVAGRSDKAQLKTAMKRAQGRPVGWVRFLHSQLCSLAVFDINAGASPHTKAVRRCCGLNIRSFSPLRSLACCPLPSGAFSFPNTTPGRGAMMATVSSGWQKAITGAGCFASYAQRRRLRLQRLPGPLPQQARCDKRKPVCSKRYMPAKQLTLCLEINEAARHSSGHCRIRRPHRAPVAVALHVGRVPLKRSMPYLCSTHAGTFTEMLIKACSLNSGVWLACARASFHVKRVNVNY